QARLVHRTGTAQFGAADSAWAGDRRRAAGSKHRAVQVSRRFGHLAAGVVLGLSTQRRPARGARDLHESRLQSTLRAADEREGPLPWLSGRSAKAAVADETCA